jgi:hypothetical protein
MKTHAINTIDIEVISHLILLKIAEYAKQLKAAIITKIKKFFIT